MFKESFGSFGWASWKCWSDIQQLLTKLAHLYQAYTIPQASDSCGVSTELQEACLWSSKHYRRRKPLAILCILTKFIIVLDWGTVFCLVYTASFVFCCHLNIPQLKTLAQAPAQVALNAILILSETHSNTQNYLPTSQLQVMYSVSWISWRSEDCPFFCIIFDSLQNIASCYQTNLSNRLEDIWTLQFNSLYCPTIFHRTGS